MTDKTADRRTIRTRKLLRQALIDLIEEKGMERITVSDLTARAEVNRGTFYLHYRDVADLLEQWQEECYEGLATVASRLDIILLVQHADKEEPYEGLVAILEYWKQNSDFLKVMLGPRGDPAFVLRLKQLMMKMIYGKLPQLLHEESRMPVPLDYLIAYMASANLGVLQHWFANGLKESPKDIGRMMTKLVNVGPLGTAGVRRLSAAP